MHKMILLFAPKRIDPDCLQFFSSYLETGLITRFTCALKKPERTDRGTVFKSFTSYYVSLILYLPFPVNFHQGFFKGKFNLQQGQWKKENLVEKSAYPVSVFSKKT